MNNFSTLFKLNGLIYITIAALLVFLPQQTIAFLSDTNPAPAVAIISIGVVLNLLGLLMLWLGNQKNTHPKWLKIIAVLDFMCVILLLILMATELWITSVNGITAAGLTAIIVSWLGWSLWQNNQP